jgi:hypothetical protein
MVELSAFEPAIESVFLDSDWESLSSRWQIRWQQKCCGRCDSRTENLSSGKCIHGKIEGTF